MKTISVLFFLVFTSLSALVLGSCGSDENPTTPVSNNNDSCGTDHNTFEDYRTPFRGDDIPTSTYLDGSERYFNFYYEVDSICTDNHVEGNFVARFNNIPTIKFYSAIEWQIFWEKRDTGRYEIEASGTKLWNSTIPDLGLRVPFQDDPASVFVNVYLHFPTQGSLSADTTYLHQNVNLIGMDFYGKYHKSSADDNHENKRSENSRTDLPPEKKFGMEKLNSLPPEKPKFLK